MTDQMWVGATAILLAFGVFAVSRWWEHQRCRRARACRSIVHTVRYDRLPLPVHFSDKSARRPPVLVSHDRAAREARHNVQFRHSGPTSQFSLLSEKER